MQQQSVHFPFLSLLYPSLILSLFSLFLRSLLPIRPGHGTVSYRFSAFVFLPVLQGIGAFSSEAFANAFPGFLYTFYSPFILTLSAPTT